MEKLIGKKTEDTGESTKTIGQKDIPRDVDNKVLDPKEKHSDAAPSTAKSIGDSMRALIWHGTRDMRYETVPKPELKEPHDALIQVLATSICGSDLHMYNGEIIKMKKGDIVGHEFMGRVVAVGDEVKATKVGHRVVVSFNIACGTCEFCRREEYTACDSTNPSKDLEDVYGHRSLGGLFGYSHLTGGYSGGQAEFVRVPYADINCLILPADVPDEHALFLSDVIPTAYHAVAELGAIKRGDVVGIWGLGPVGLMCARWCQILGASRVIGISGTADRLRLASSRLGIELIDYHKENVVSALQKLVPRGLDLAIDAAGFRYTKSFLHSVERALSMESDSPEVLTECAMAVRKFGRISVIADYIGFANHFPIGHIAMKHITLSAGQSPTQRNWHKCLEVIRKEILDPTFIITHRGTLSNGPMFYKKFNVKEEGIVKVVMRPEALPVPLVDQPTPPPEEARM
jgi:threonine dehydrogenase-like Zn-dependent dehydrogenase